MLHEQRHPVLSWKKLLSWKKVMSAVGVAWAIYSTWPALTVSEGAVSDSVNPTHTLLAVTNNGLLPAEDIHVWFRMIYGAVGNTDPNRLRFTCDTPYDHDPHKGSRDLMQVAELNRSQSFSFDPTTSVNFYNLWATDQNGKTREFGGDLDVMLTIKYQVWKVPITFHTQDHFVTLVRDGISHWVRCPQ